MTVPSVVSRNLNCRSGEKYNQAFLDASDRLVCKQSGKPDPESTPNRATTHKAFKKAEEPTPATPPLIEHLPRYIVPMATYYLYVG